MIHHPKEGKDREHRGMSLDDGKQKDIARQEGKDGKAPHDR